MSAEELVGFLLSMTSVLDGVYLPLSAGRLALVVVSGLLLAYIAYYFGWVAGRPQVVGAGVLKETLIKKCPILSECYWPTFWAYQCHLSTIMRFLLQKNPSITYRREILALADGGEVALDWGLFNTDSSPSVPVEAAQSPAPSTVDTPATPVLLILPGITGCSRDNYVQHLVEDGLLEKYRPIVFNQRGNGGIKLKTLRTYSGSDIGDVLEVIHYIQKCYPSAPIVGLGVSLGGMILTQCLHQLGKECDLSAVISVSAGWRPFMSRKSLEEGLINKFGYSRVMVSNIKALVLSNVRELTEEQLQNLPVSLKQIMEAKLMSDIDTHLTAPLFGFSCLEDYYDSCRNDDKIHKIRRPLVCITSADDPFVPKASLPYEEFEHNAQTVMVVTSHGGHFGFIEGLYPSNKTWLDRATRQILATFKDLFKDSPR